MNEPGPSMPLQWRDTSGRLFDVLLESGRIRLEADSNAIELPRERWPLDLYVAPYAGGFLVRVETFAQSVQFVLSQADAAPLLFLLQPPQDSRHVPSEAQRQEPEGPAYEVATWPKVSPLAVWALICSSLVFIPVAGLLPALLTIVLLIVHRLYVPRSATMMHSRALCLGAFLFLSVGLIVSAMAAISLRANQTNLEHTSLFDVADADARNWGMIISGILVVVLSLSVHEAAHAITAWWLGDGLAKSLGRVTLNPIAHIDPVGTVLLPVLLAMFKQPVFGYARPVPVYVDNLPRYRRAHILISVAGPGSNLLLAAASFMLLLGLVCGLKLAVPDADLMHLATGSFSVPVEASGFPMAAYFALACTLLKLSFVINIALAMFNLIPIPPLDGSWVLEHLFPRTLGPVYAMLRPYGFLIFVVAMYGDLFVYLSKPVYIVLAAGLALLAAATGW